MKKIIILSVASCLLCACAGSMHGLRVHNTGVQGKQEINGGLYYNDPKAIGHDQHVKHKVIDETHAQIEIPVNYQAKMVALPKKLPNALKNALKEYDLESPGSCEGFCSLTNKKFTLNLDYYDKSENSDCSGYYVGFVLWPLLPFTIPAYINECTGIELKTNKQISFSNPFETFNEKNLGVRMSYKITPKEMTLHCGKKYCELLNDQGNPVNQINVIAKMSVDQKRINELIVQERKAKEAAEKKEREEAAARQKWYEEADAVCPSLIKQMQYMQYNPYAYDIKTQKGIRFSFQKYNCADYAYIIMNDL